MVSLSTTKIKYLALYYYMRQILLRKALCEGLLSHMDKLSGGCKIKSNAFEENMGCIYTSKFNYDYRGTKHVATHVNFFSGHIYDKDKNPHSDILLEK